MPSPITTTASAGHASSVLVSRPTITLAASNASPGRPSKSFHPTIAASPTEREQLSKIGASPPHTESTSPPSSNEFATADFYFEDSMPSPLASSSEKQREENSSSSDIKQVADISKTNTLVSSLQAELANREVLIRELEEKLKEHIPPISQQRQDVVLSDNSATVAPCLSSSDATSTPPMEDALDVSLVLGKFDAMRNGDTPVEELQRSLEHANADLAKAKMDLLHCEKLKLALEQASEDLAKAKDNLFESESALREKEEESKRALLEKDSVIQDLRGQLDCAHGELVKSAAAGAEQEKKINSLQEIIYAHETKAKELTMEVTLSKESLKEVKGKLISVRDSLIRDLSPLKQGLVELR